ncbi:MAG TPA: ATP-binding protein [Thermodesulfovibrionales bacterium]|nr:ATP-binding protein [Thermodesulfovibrionales bacterium]
MAEDEEKLRAQLEELRTALKASEALFCNVINKSADGILIMDKKGRILFVNPTAEQMFGRKAGDLLGEEFGYPVLANEKTEIEILLRGKQRVVVEMRITETEWEGEDASLAALRDITERKMMEEHLTRLTGELASSNKDLEQFANIVSHDIRAPLRSIKSFSEILANDYRGIMDEDAGKMLDRIIRGAVRMEQMVNAILSFCKVGKSIETVDLDFESILVQAMENLQVVIEEKRAIITHDPLPRVMADQTQMILLLQNLLGNAVKFSKGTPQVHVSAVRHGSEWIFSVKDNGIGIDRKQFDRLFVLFQRLHTEEEYPGTGLGLAMCKKIVEGHGGRIWVESEPGKGSQFYFTIPFY